VDFTQDPISKRNKQTTRFIVYKTTKELCLCWIFPSSVV